MTTWRRPCDAGHCIEVSTDVPGLNPGDIAIRNSQRPGTVVVASAEEYAAWVADVSAPLLAELAEVTRQRDEARANECTALCRDIEQDRDEIRAALDEARAKVDGGKWQWGVRWAGLDGKPIDWLQGVTETGAREFVAESDNGATLVRRRVGPVEPVSDDGSGT